MIEIIPPQAPFDEAQRRALNAYFNELISGLAPSPPTAPPPEDAAETLPWNDPALPIGERMALADQRPVRWRLHAAMAQQDCGQCGYTCADYSAAIFEQAEPRLGLCQPGGKATARMLKALIGEMGGGAIGPPDDEQPTPPRLVEASGGQAGASRERPALARLVSRRRLNGEGSEKTTLHVELDLTETGLGYTVGDSLGVLATNPPELADAVIAAIRAPPDFPILDRTLREVLIEDMSLAPAPDALFELVSYLTGGDRRRKAKALARGEDPDGDLDRLDVLAALEKFPGIHPDPEAFVEALEPLQPRLYSISSSPNHQPGRVTLTVDLVRYALEGRERHGVASSFLGHRHGVGETLRVYVQKAHGFALPANPGKPIIMVGPGTGVAPFRAFLQERRHAGATGGAWLFFGHQRPSDFLYQEEMEGFLAQGALSRLSLAWSRHGPEKVYVQHRMSEAGADLFAWLERGAHFYICGDAKHMARDVGHALENVLIQHGGLDPDSAASYILKMKTQGRYQTDVY